MIIEYPPIVAEYPKFLHKLAIGIIKVAINVSGLSKKLANIEKI